MPPGTIAEMKAGAGALRARGALGASPSSTGALQRVWVREWSRGMCTRIKEWMIWRKRMARAMQMRTLQRVWVRDWPRGMCTRIKGRMVWYEENG